MKEVYLKVKHIDYSQPGYKTMFANYGLTAIAALSLEKVIWLLVTAIDNLNKNHNSTQEIHDCLEQHKRKTMGYLVKELYKRIDISSQLKDDLEEAIKKRNFIIHHFFIESFNSLKNNPSALNDELLPIRDFFLSVHSKIDTFVEEINKPYEEISPEIKQCIKSFIS